MQVVTSLGLFSSDAQYKEVLYKKKSKLDLWWNSIYTWSWSILLKNIWCIDSTMIFCMKGMSLMDNNFSSSQNQTMYKLWKIEQWIDVGKLKKMDKPE